MPRPWQILEVARAARREFYRRDAGTLGTGGLDHGPAGPVTKRDAGIFRRLSSNSSARIIGGRLPIVFLLAFGESLAFLSLFIPAWALLVAIGALINASGLVFWPIWLAAAAGAASGDWVSYWFGFHFKDRIAHMWPLSRHPDMLPRGHAFMEKWGIAGHLHRPLFRAAARRRCR